MSLENVELLLQELEDVPSDEGLLLAMSWLADGLEEETMPEMMALAAFAGLVQEARRRGLVR